MPRESIINDSGNNVGDIGFSTSFDSTVTTSAPASGNTDNFQGDGQGDGGSVVISQSFSNNVGNVDTTSTSNGGAIGMMLQPTMIPMVAGGILAAAAVNMAAFL